MISYCNCASTVSSQHLEQCNSWALITQACQKNHLFGTEGASSYGALVGLTVEAASTVLRNVAMVAVVGVTSSDGSKEPSQAALETLLRSHSISRLSDACRVYGASMSDKCVAQVVNVFVELVLNSSKFFAQFIDVEGLMALDELPSCIFSGHIDGQDPQDDLESAQLDERHAEQYAQYASCARYDALPALSLVHGSALTRVGSPQRNSPLRGAAPLSPVQLALLCRAETLIAALQLSSQLARNSEKYYAMLSNVFTAPKLVWILTQPNRVARAKCCNLIGNLCR